MASFDDDADGAGGSGDEFDNEDEEMEDVDQDQDQDQGQDDDGADEDDEDDNDDGDGDGDNDEDDDEEHDPDSPSRRASQHASGQRFDGDTQDDAGPARSPRPSAVRSPSSAAPAVFIPSVRTEALTAQAYDIVPTMAAPHSTSINALTATPDMHWVFSGGSDGYVRMYNWVETANGKTPLTVAQKHPFVDSVMKAGSLLTYWENEEPVIRTPPAQGDEGKELSPVYSLAVQNQAIWLLSGLESGGINLQTCRHQAGTRIMTLREHTSAVSVLNLARDETSVLSGSWDKTVLDWDLQSGKVKRSFLGIGGQVSTIQIRPTSDVHIPEVTETIHESLGTFSSNNADRPSVNGGLGNRRESRGQDEDAMGSPSSLFGEDHGSLFGEDAGTAGGGSNAFGDDDESLERTLTGGTQEGEQDAPGEQDTEMDGVGNGGPVQPPEPAVEASEPEAIVADDVNTDEQEVNGDKQVNGSDHVIDGIADSQPVTNGLPHSDEPLTAPPTDDSSTKGVSAADLPPQSESTFLDASYNGSIRIWDRRMPSPIATLSPFPYSSPWCMGACWSPDGNFIYAGRRNDRVDEYSIHKMGTNRNKPERTFKFQHQSGPVSAVRAMPNGRHLVW